MNKNKSQNLEEIPGIGKKIAGDFYNIGIKEVSDLKDKDLKILYKKLCTFHNIKVDKYILYFCRAVVYFIETEKLNTGRIK